MVRFVVSWLLILCSASVSGKSDICENLYEHACDLENNKIGMTMDTADANFRKIDEGAIKVLEDGFRAAIEKPDPYLTKLAISAFGQSEEPECELTAGKPKPQCINKLVRGLVRAAQRGIVTGRGPNAGLSSRISKNEKPEFIPVEIRDTILLQKNISFKEIRTKAIEFVISKIRNEGTSKHIREEVFPKIKQKIKEKIREYVDDPKARDQLIDKVENVQPKDGCFNKESGQILVPLLTPNAVYLAVDDTSTSSVHVCDSLTYLNKSDFQAASIIAHEIFHSVDPCNVVIGPSKFSFRYSDPQNRDKSDSEYPLKGLISCLRSKESVEAKHLGTPSQSEVENSIVPIYCDKGNSDPDEITETVPDWIASEVLPEYIEENFKDLTPEDFRSGYASAYRAMCPFLLEEKLKKKTDEWMLEAGVQPQPEPKDEHPMTEKRINRLFLVNPKVRRQMGCPPHLTGVTYCKLSTATKNSPATLSRDREVK